MDIAELQRATAMKVIAAMETSGTNWCKDWTPKNGQRPTSISTGKAYSGINTLILGLTRMATGWQSHEYGTFKAWRAKGCNVAKGQKATHIVWYGSGTRKVLNDDGTEEDQSWRAARPYAVFNAEQVAHYTPADMGNVPEVTTKPNTAMDKLAGDVSANVRNEDLARAFYVPSADYINMPAIDQFTSAEAYACTLGHELTHWTGHKSRLDRNKDNYAIEELVAELGSAMLAASLGISPEPCDGHAKYLNNWIKDIRDKPATIMSAAAKAQAATSYLLDAQATSQIGLAA